MTDKNALVGKEYDKETYHCWHFIEEAINVPKLKDVHVDAALDNVEKYKELFKQLDTPVDNCIVLLGKSHIGIYYNDGIYHNDVGGVRYENMRVMKMKYRTIVPYEVRT